MTLSSRQHGRPSASGHHSLEVWLDTLGGYSHGGCQLPSVTWPQNEKAAKCRANLGFRAQAGPSASLPRQLTAVWPSQASE